MDVNNSFADGAILAATTETHIGRLTINRPEKRNALNDAMWRALPAALEWLVDTGDARVVVVEGASGRDFSAGADIGEFETLRKDAATAQQYEAGNAAAFAAIRTCPVPVIAAIRRHMFWWRIRHCRGSRPPACRQHSQICHSGRPARPGLSA